MFGDLFLCWFYDVKEGKWYFLLENLKKVGIYYEWIWDIKNIKKYDFYISECWVILCLYKYKKWFLDVNLS